MYSGRKNLTVAETIAELYSDPLSDISDIESSDTEIVYSNLPTQKCVENFAVLLSGR
jgi:hypothetical protein